MAHKSKYQERMVARKREFGVRFPPLTDSPNAQETTIPAPMGWEYTRGYYPSQSGYIDKTPLPHELRDKNLWKFLKRFEY